MPASLASFIYYTIRLFTLSKSSDYGSLVLNNPVLLLYCVDLLSLSSHTLKRCEDGRLATYARP